MENRWSGKTTQEGEIVKLESLAELTGFPTEFIKTELMVEDEEISIHQLRSSVLDYLEKSFVDAS